MRWLIAGLLVLTLAGFINADRLRAIQASGGGPGAHAQPLLVPGAGIWDTTTTTRAVLQPGGGTWLTE